PERSADKAARKADRAQAAAERQAQLAARRPLLKEADTLERKLAGWQAEKDGLDARLADPALYADSGKALLADLLKQQAELAAGMEAAELRWLEVHEALDALDAGVSD
ncbi:MAG: ABC transporter ATP-binding protein, partial [Rhodocyclaceae bacterium]|nr:ABC transporter ATP-binding protein [Rhodocyclaceae bacterium]